MQIAAIRKSAEGLLDVAIERIHEENFILRRWKQQELSICFIRLQIYGFEPGLNFMPVHSTG